MSCAMEAGPPVDLDLGRLRDAQREPQAQPPDRPLPDRRRRRVPGGVHGPALGRARRLDTRRNRQHRGDGRRPAGASINRRHVAKQVDAWIEELTTRYRKLEFADAAQARGIPCMPVNSLSDLLQDPHLRAADAWTALDISGFGPLRIVKPPLVFDGQRADAGAVPEPGADTDAILRADLSASDGQIARWRAEKSCETTRAHEHRLRHRHDPVLHRIRRRRHRAQPTGTPQRAAPRDVRRDSAAGRAVRLRRRRRVHPADRRRDGVLRAATCAGEGTGATAARRPTIARSGAAIPSPIRPAPLSCCRSRRRSRWRRCRGPPSGRAPASRSRPICASPRSRRA